MIVALLAEGHILIEDLPGVGKTTLARAVARSLDLEFARVQCTADLLPADVVGTNVFNRVAETLRLPSRADLRERRARRRDQPRLAEDAVRAARVHAGAARHGRRPHARDRAAVHRARDTEPGRVRGHLPAARGAGRPLHGPPVDGLSGARRRGGHAARQRVGRPRRARRARSRPQPRCSRPRRRCAACTSPTRCARTSSRCSCRTREDRRVELGASPRAGLLLLRASKARAAARGPRPRAARRRARARRGGARAPHRARSRGGRHLAERRRSPTRSLTTPAR